MHYAVPQFIEVEDKIIGPLTMKQFMWLLGGGAVSFVLYFMLKFGVWLMLSILIFGLFGSLAFIRIYNMPLASFLGSLVRFSLMPQIFLWKKKAEGPLKEVPERVIFEERFQAPMPEKPRPAQGKIRQLAWQLDFSGSPEAQEGVNEE